MNTKEKKRDLALHRLQQAEESLAEAKYLFEPRQPIKPIGSERR